MAALATDDFNRANSGTLGANWTTPPATNTLSISSNKAVPTDFITTDSINVYTGGSISWPNDQYSKAVLACSGTAGGDQGIELLVRASTSASLTWYSLTVDKATTNNVGIYKFVSGTYTHIAAATQSWSDGDTWEFRVQGTTLTARRNGAIVLTTTDASIASGSAGIGFSTSDAGTASIDNWEGGDLTNVLAFDNFNRANGGLGANWTNQPNSTNGNTIQIASNVANMRGSTNNGDNSAFYSGITWPNDQYSRGVLTDTDTGAAGDGYGPSLMVRASGSGNFGTGSLYRVNLQHSATLNVYLEKCVAGVFTTINTYTQAWANGDVWELKIVGTTITITHVTSNTVVATETDTDIASGSSGISWSGSNPTVSTIDDWEGGSIPAAGGGGTGPLPLQGRKQTKLWSIAQNWAVRR